VRTAVIVLIGTLFGMASMIWISGAGPVWAQSAPAPPGPSPQQPVPDPAMTPAQPGTPPADPGTPPAAGARPPRPSLVDELLLRPSRLTGKGRKQYADGNHPQALADFERALRARPQDPRGRFNLADGLYKNGKFDEAATLFRSLGEDPDQPLAGPAEYNLGNTLYQKKDYRGAIRAYRDALEHSSDDMDTRKNLELALRALKEQEEQQKKDQQKQNQQNNQDQKDQQKSAQNDSQQKQQQKSPGQNGAQPPLTAAEQENERFKQQTGMPKDRAMQLLDALQQNERAEQRRLLLERRAKRKGGKDW
jgi:tetratricopeptide (TPR) repeat protein